MTFSHTASLVFLLAVVAAGAATAAPAQTLSEQLPLGTQTRALVELQKDPKAQAPDARPMPGEVADEVYKRYVNSFKYPIPEQFKRQSSGSGGGSGSSGDGSSGR